MAKQRKQQESEFPFTVSFKVSEEQRTILKEAAYKHRISVAEEIRQRVFEPEPEDVPERKSRRIMLSRAKKMTEETGRISTFIEALCNDLSSLMTTTGGSISESFWDRQIKSLRSGMRKLEHSLFDFNSQFGEETQDNRFANVTKYVWTTVSGPLEEDAKPFESKTGNPMFSFRMMVTDVLKGNSFTAPFQVYVPDNGDFQNALKKGAVVSAVGNLHFTLRNVDGKPVLLRTLYAEEVKILSDGN